MFLFRERADKTVVIDNGLIRRLVACYRTLGKELLDVNRVGL